jgi:hypothetical protein
MYFFSSEKSSTHSIRLEMSNLAVIDSVRRAKTAISRTDQRKIRNNGSQDYKKYL